MIYLIDTPKYYEYLISPIPDYLSCRNDFIRYFNLENEYD